MTNIDLCATAYLLCRLMNLHQITQQEARFVFARIASKDASNIAFPLSLLSNFTSQTPGYDT